MSDAVAASTLLYTARIDRICIHYIIHIYQIYTALAFYARAYTQCVYDNTVLYPQIHVCKVEGWEWERVLGKRKVLKCIVYNVKTSNLLFKSMRDIFWFTFFFIVQYYFYWNNVFLILHFEALSQYGMRKEKKRIVPWCTVGSDTCCDCVVVLLTAGVRAMNLGNGKKKTRKRRTGSLSN